MLLALLAITWSVYWPGLTGGFLFDDYINLDALGRFGPVNQLPVFWRYITSGTADPTGRPLALLSFLLDAHDWPADPAPFLRTNLLIHVLNCALLFQLLRRLNALLGDPESRSDSIAWLATAMWALHPFLVSTTLYVVQRETMLSSTFVLAGLLLYVSGRSAYGASNGSKGTATAMTGLLACTALATLCKANGLLLPLLALVLEATVFARLARADGSTRLPMVWRLTLWLPFLLLCAYIGHFALSWNSVPDGRHWTIGQRLLTEPRALAGYLGHLVWPSAISGGFYNDDFSASTDLWHPASTFFCGLLILVLASGALFARHVLPSVSAALLFFFCGHLLESTAVPLELYYQHRNYLPAMLLFWPLARAIGSPKIEPKASWLAGCSLLAILAFDTYSRASLWGVPGRFAEMTALVQPNSQRAQVVSAVYLTSSGQSARAARLILATWRAHPDELQLALTYADAARATDPLSAADTASVCNTLRRTDSNPEMAYQWLSDRLAEISAGNYPGIDIDGIASMLAAAKANPRLGSRIVDLQSIASLEGKLALARHLPDVALNKFNAALNFSPGPEIALMQAATLADAGFFSRALAHLDVYERNKAILPTPPFGMPRLHAYVLQRQGYWNREIAGVRAALIRAQSNETDANGSNTK